MEDGQHKDINRLFGVLIGFGCILIIILIILIKILIILENGFEIIIWN